MFPKFCEDHSGEEIFSFYGYEERPAYRYAESEDNTDSGLAKAIREVKNECCGYIEGNTIKYNTCDIESYFINMDDEYVFAYFYGVVFNDNFPLFLLFDFLKFKAKKMLLVYEDTNFLFEKTDDTYKVCVKIDDIYESPSFLHEILIKSIGEGNYDNIFYKLAEIYSYKHLNKKLKDNSLLSIFLKIYRLDIK